MSFNQQKTFGIFLLAACLAAGSASAAEKRLKTHSETRARYGHDRQVVASQIWTPLRQEEDRVLFGDLRASSDNLDNREANLGLGYRVLTDQKILGGYGYLDRRRTALGSDLWQATFGGEYITDPLEIRVNGYLPLNQGKKFTGVNLTGPYLAGSSIYIPGPLEFREEAQRGFDLEFGTRLPLNDMPWIDSVRVYGGGYAFFGHQTDGVKGLRGRVEVDVGSWLQLGGRAQHDTDRGMQYFAEMTVRWPGTLRHQDVGLWSRMDDAPERDVDIVTASAETDGAPQPITNTATGQAQRIIYVSNTAAVGGNGTFEKPYDTLAAAELAALPHDMIYIFKGDGTVRGQDTGLTLSRPDITVMGEGSPLVYDSGVFRAPDGLDYTGLLLRPAGDKPLLTNVNGDGITIDADHILLQGLQVDGANGYGVVVQSDVRGASLDNMAITGNTNSGLAIKQSGTGTLDIKVRNSMMTGNLVYGIEVDRSSGDVVVDLGSDFDPGDNAIFGNIAQEIYADTGGSSVRAAGNYWGGGTLLDVVGPDQGRIEASTYLAASTACTTCQMPTLDFSDQSDVLENQRIRSDPVTLNGFSGSRFIQVSGTGAPELVINGIPQGTSKAKVKAGDQVAVDVISSQIGLDSRDVHIDLGSATEDFHVRTRFLPNLFTNLVGWWDGHDLDGDFIYSDQPSNGASVAVWADKSGNGNTALQSTAGLQPIYRNTTGGVTVDGVDDLMKTTNSGTIAALRTDLTLYMVLAAQPTQNGVPLYLQGNCTGLASSRCLLLSRDGAGDDLALRTDTNAARNQTATDVSGTVFDGKSHLVGLNISGSSRFVRVDGTDTFTDTYAQGAGVTGAAGLTLVNPINGTYYETLLFNGTLSATDQGLVETYLTQKWGL